MALRSGGAARRSVCEICVPIAAKAGAQLAAAALAEILAGFVVPLTRARSRGRSA